MGQIDIAPATAPAEKLLKYRCLMMLAWNTMTDDTCRNLATNARDGGALFLGIPQFSIETDRYKPWNLIHGGDLRELCGVKISGPEEQTKGCLMSWTGNAAQARVLRKSVCGIRRGERNDDCSKYLFSLNTRVMTGRRGR